MRPSTSTSVCLSLCIGVVAFGCTADSSVPAEDDVEPTIATPVGAPSETAPLSEATIGNPAPLREKIDESTEAPLRRFVRASGLAVEHTAHARTLILYDVGGDRGWVGELYAAATANLVSHFGTWHAVPARSYTCGDVESYTATIYLGSSFGEPLPPCLLDDVAATRRRVMWVDVNFWQLVSRVGTSAFVSRFGIDATHLDTTSRFSSVRYRGRTLTRNPDNAGLLAIEVTDRVRVTELATAVRTDGTTAPWAVRSGNLIVVSEIPFSFTSEEDRVLAFEDMLFDLLAPWTVERHRAMLRLEDVNPTSDPRSLRAIADYLSSRGVPFGIGMVSQYRDPLSVYPEGPRELALRDAPLVVDALQYMLAHGGTLVMHGWTHQWNGGRNPYNELTGDDTEFFRIVQNPDETFSFVGPLPEDSIAWASGRIVSAEGDFRGVGLPVPTIFEFPHYAASANSYAAAATLMSARWERASYYGGVLGGGTIDHTRALGQMFPYVVRDVYGSTVLPENLGNVDLVVWHGLPTRSPADIVRAADRNLVIRDGVACFFYHPFLPIEYLQQTVEGIRALGYQFVSPTSL